MNADLPPAAPDPDCELCSGRGVVVVAGKIVAEGQVCTCVGMCTRCANTGRVVLEHDGQSTVGRCRCRLPHDRAALLTHAGIPARYAGATLLSFARGARAHADHEKDRSMQDVSRWLGGFRPGEFNRGLVLWGPVGRGKTHLLVSIVRTLVLDHGVPCRFMEFARLLGILREGFSQGRSGGDVMGELASVQVLAIDELGKGRLTDWELTVIDEVVSRRYNAMGTLLGTTNYPPATATGAGPGNLSDTRPGSRQTLGDRVGDRVHSRLTEMCDYAEVGGLDFRTLKGR